MLETKMENAVWTKVIPSWSCEKVRQETASFVGAYKMAMWNTLKDQPDLLLRFQDQVFQDRMQDMESKGISKTPLGLVMYLAELTVNMAGGVISVSGDDREATISYDEIAGWDRFKSQLGTDQERAELLTLMQSTLNRFSARLGFRCTVQALLDSPQPLLRITFLI
jgi:hypothetical protein